MVNGNDFDKFNFVEESEFVRKTNAKRKEPVESFVEAIDKQISLVKEKIENPDAEKVETKQTFAKPIIGRRNRSKGPTRALSMNIPEKDFILFQNIADHLDKTYNDTLVILMKEYIEKNTV